MGTQRNGGDTLRPLIEAVEARLLFSSIDPAITAYQSRASQVLSSNISSIAAWAAMQTGTDNLSTGSLSEWTAAAAFTDSGSNQSVVNDGYLLLGSLMEYRVNHLFAGGNDGWEAWATADTYLRYRSVIDADTVRYAPSGYATNPNSTDGKYSLDDLCKIVLTKSFYGPVDSTSNHFLTNATACYLANQAFPGQVVQNFNNETSDPTGANTLLSRAESLFADGPERVGEPVVWQFVEAVGDHHAAPLSAALIRSEPFISTQSVTSPAAASASTARLMMRTPISLPRV